MTELEKQIARQIADFIFTESQQNLVKLGAIDTGFLLKSGKIIDQPSGADIFYDAPYAWAVNFGTDPHGVNPKVLEGWVRRKLGIKNEKQAKSVAFLIARKISQRGTEPQPFMDQAIETAKIKFKGQLK